MNRKRYSSLLFGVLALSLVLFGIPLKVSAYHSGSQPDLAANPELVAFRNYVGFSFDDLALVSSYPAPGSPVLKVDSGRWSAIGFYHGQYLAMLRGAEADSARWVARGTFYSGEMARALPPDSIRRSSLGFYYAEKLAKLQRDREDAARVSFPSQAAAIDYFLAELRSAKADSARWAALGDRYLARGRDADSARWVAMAASYGASVVFSPELILGRSYDNLASNPELLSLQQYDTCGC